MLWFITMVSMWAQQIVHVGGVFRGFASPSYANRGNRSLDILLAFRRSVEFPMQVASHVDTGHDDGFASEHYILLAFDVCASGDFVSRVLFCYA